MNGAHDLGGMDGFGPVVPEADEPAFHESWEGRVFALNIALRARGAWNIDESRYARETMAPGEYLATSYYEHWLHGLERLLEDKGLLGEGTVAGGALAPDAVRPALARGRSARVDTEANARFAPGDRVRVRNHHPYGHTRAPRYVRGRAGTVERGHGVFVFPDAHAHGAGECPQHVYSVRFEAVELWGPGIGGRDAVYVDLWNDYLEPA